METFSLSSAHREKLTNSLQCKKRRPGYQNNFHKGFEKFTL